MAEYTHESAGRQESFSWSPCPRCGSKLGGSRFEWNYRDENDEIQQDVCCIDCVFEINGIEQEGD